MPIFNTKKETETSNQTERKPSAAGMPSGIRPSVAKPVNVSHPTAASTSAPAAPAAPASARKPVDVIAQEVIRGDWGNGAARAAKLKEAGYDANLVQKAVNHIMSGNTAPAANLDEIARKVIRGEFGNGAERRTRVEAAGYNYDAVQARVNQLLK